MDVSQRRLRCIGHIVNLAVRVVIFGSNVSKFETELREATDEFSFDIWAKKGAIGRLHNLATYIRRTDQRRQGGHGAVWETLKTMDYLFVKFKQAAEETQFEEPSHFKSGIDCGWVKLEDYYVKSDRTPVYRAALALHPSYGYDYFERHWKTAMDRPQWYNDMQSAVGSLFGEYAREAEVEAQAQAGLLEDGVDDIEADVNDYSSFGKRSIRSLNTQRKKVKAVGELDIFQTRPIYAHDLDVADPLEWWNRHQLEYPVLYRMALDLFSIPGMSSECERVFSQTKKMITDERTGTIRPT